MLSDDLSNVLNGVDIPILILDRNRRIRRSTPPAQKLLGLRPATSAGRSEPPHRPQPPGPEDFITAYQKDQPMWRVRFKVKMAGGTGCVYVLFGPLNRKSRAF